MRQHGHCRWRRCLRLKDARKWVAQENQLLYLGRAKQQNVWGGWSTLLRWQGIVVVDVREVVMFAWTCLCM
jgi:hypothetical protein